MSLLQPKEILQIAELSEGGKATIKISQLTQEQKLFIESIMFLGDFLSGDIVFGKFNEATLRIINDAKHGVLVSVIMPIDEFGRPSYLENETVLI